MFIQIGVTYMFNMYTTKQSKSRPVHGVKTVDVSRGKAGYGFTISGQNPCILSYIVAGSPAERVGLKPGDCLLSVNTENVSKYLHDDVIRMIGMSTGTLTLQVAENYNSSDSSDDDYQVRQKSRHHKRLKPRPSSTAINNENKVPKMSQRSSQQSHRDLMNERMLVASRHNRKTRSSTQNRVRFEPTVDVLHSQPQSDLNPLRSKQSGHSKSYSSSNIQQMSKKHGTSSLRPGVYPGGPAFSSRDNSRDARTSMPRPKSLSAVQYLYHNYRHERRISDIDERMVEGRVATPQPSRLNTTPVDSEQESSSRNIHPMIAPLEQQQLMSRNASIASLSSNRDLLLHVLVGYVGSLEMPNPTKLPDNRLQSIRHAVRRLRVENKIHTLVLMDVFESEIRLTNSFGNILATYPVEKLAFTGVCPDNNRFFGIVTHHSADNKSGWEWTTSGSSCHVFMTDLEMVPHEIHESKAQAFGFQCTYNEVTENCNEFPVCSKPIIRVLSQLVITSLGSKSGEILPCPFADPTIPAVPQNRSNSFSSNSDSGLGFGRDDNTYVVNIHRHPAYSSIDTSDSFSNSANFLHNTPVLPRPGMHKTHYVIEDRLSHVQNLDDTRTSMSSENVSNHRQPARIGYHTTPDRSGLSELGANHADNMRRNVHKFINDRQRKISESASNTSSDLSQSFVNDSRSFSTSRITERPRSAPYRQLSNTSQSSRTEDSSLHHKLSPHVRVRPSALSINVRSPSAPPLGEDFNQSDNEFDDGFTADDAEARFDADMLRATSGNDDQRRFSDGHAVMKQREVEGSDETSRPLKKSASLRRQKNFNHSISHSHESLFTAEQETSNNWKLLSAVSVTCVSPKNKGLTTNHTSPQVIGRVAGWAVSLDRLLKDHAGLVLFTEFSEKEFSEENVNFWKTCEEFRKLSDQDQLKKRAQEIYDQHISAKATDPVNVDSTARRDAEEHLDNPSTDMYNTAQTQIFQLMKQDIYSRFLKSDMFKSSLMGEMEGKPIDPPQTTPTVATQPKLKGGHNAEEKKRRSLLPWMKMRNSKAKTTSREKLGGIKEDMFAHLKPSMVNVDLSLMGQEVSKEVPESGDSQQPINNDQNSRHKFCRVILPNGATTVVCAKQGQTIRTVLGQLCDKRNISLNAIEVLLLGSDTCVNLEDDVSTLGSKEIVIERRVLFRMDLPNRKSIGVKAKPNRPIRDVLRPILNKYNFKMESVSIKVNGEIGVVELDAQTSTLDNLRLVVMLKEERATNDDRRMTANKPPIPSSKSTNHNSAAASLDEITNQVFDDLMHGKSKIAHNFDDGAVIDIEDREKTEKKDDEPRLSGLFWLLKKEALALKEGRMKTSTINNRLSKISTTLPRSAVKKSGSVNDENKFFELLERMQSNRLDDQRGITLKSLEMPDFLKKPEEIESDTNQKNTTNNNSKFIEHHAIKTVDNHVLENTECMITDDDIPINHSDKKSIGSVNVFSLRGSGMSYDSRSISSFKTFGSPVSIDRLSYMDRSFSQDFIFPDNDEAARYFDSYDSIENPNHRPGSVLDGRTIDIGMTAYSNFRNASLVSLSSNDSTNSVKNRQLRKTDSSKTTSLLAEPKATLASPDKFSCDEDSSTNHHQNGDHLYAENLSFKRRKNSHADEIIVVDDRDETNEIQIRNNTSRDQDIMSCERNKRFSHDKSISRDHMTHNGSTTHKNNLLRVNSFDNSFRNRPDMSSFNSSGYRRSISNVSSDLYASDISFCRPLSVCSSESINTISDCSLNVTEMSFEPDLTVISGRVGDDSFDNGISQKSGNGNYRNKSEVLDEISNNGISTKSLNGNDSNRNTVLDHNGLSPSPVNGNIPNMNRRNTIDFSSSGNSPNSVNGNVPNKNRNSMDFSSNSPHTVNGNIPNINRISVNFSSSGNSPHSVNGKIPNMNRNSIDFSSLGNSPNSVNGNGPNNILLMTRSTPDVSMNGKTPEDMRNLKCRRSRSRTPVVFTAELNDITFV